MKQQNIRKDCRAQSVPPTNSCIQEIVENEKRIPFKKEFRHGLRRSRLRSRPRRILGLETMKILDENLSAGEYFLTSNSNKIPLIPTWDKHVQLLGI